MGSHRLQAALACVSSILAIIVLTFWIPASLTAQIDLNPEDPAVKDLDMTRREARDENVPAPIDPDTGETIVYLQRESDAFGVARGHGLRIKNRYRSDSRVVVLSAPGVPGAEAARRSLKSDPRVRAVYPNLRSLHVRHQNPVLHPWNPNDPYFNVHTPENGWPGAWHLDNQFNAGRDVKARGAWNNGWTGFYVLIGIVDDGVQMAHPDLSGPYRAGDSWDFGTNSPDGVPGRDSDPSPVAAADNHGTCVSGVASARGGNGIGVCGTAPHAFFAMLRQDFNGNGDASEFADGTKYHSSGANTNIKIKNHSYGIGFINNSIPFNYVTTAAETAALVESAEAGTIHCFSAGNDRGTPAQDSNKKDLQNDPNALCISAIHSDDKFASYTSFGACVIAAAPAAIYTTDRTGADGYNSSGQYFPNNDYHGSFAGTSASSPVAAGIMAMVKHAQPALNGRFAKHLIARTSDQIDPTDSTEASDGGWKTNGVGFKFNQNYGFGRLNADKLTQEALKWSGVTPLQTEAVGPVTVGNLTIGDNDPLGRNHMFTLNGTTPLEEVQVTLNISHLKRGDLEAYLTSPAGTTSRLFMRSNGDDGANINWTFTTNAFWGEMPSGGGWTLNVRDVSPGTFGQWTGYTIRTRMGTLIPRITNLSPSTKPAGDSGFTLTVNGFNFPVGSQVLWNGSPRTTNRLSSSQLEAIISASDIASAGTANVSVSAAGVSTNSVPFTIAHSLSVSATSVTAGNPVTVSWKAPPGSPPLDWIGVYASGADNRAYQRWIYTGGATSGDWTINTPTSPATFEFRYLLNDHYTSVAVSPAVTTTAATYTLSAAPTTVAPGQNITVNWNAPPGRPLNDWIGLFQTGADHRNYISWIYTGGSQSGAGNFKAPPGAGTYQFRYLLNDGYIDHVATSETVTVSP